MSILEGATIEFESSNPVLTEFVNDANINLENKVAMYDIFDYLCISDNTFGDSETIDKVSKIVDMVGADKALAVVQDAVSYLGFKKGILDEVLSRLMIDREIKRTSNNLENLIKQKYGDNSSI